jgi:hypothetical protein
METDNALGPDILVYLAWRYVRVAWLHMEMYIRFVCFPLTQFSSFCSFANSNHWHDFWSFVLQYKQPALPGMPAKAD